MALKSNNYKLCAFIIFLNIKSFDKIKNKKKNKKKILVFSKSGGNEDLIQSFHKDNKNYINFYWIPRSFLKKIYKFFFKKNSKKDYFTKIFIKSDFKKKEEYTNFLISIFNYLDKLIKLDAFISFNIFYYSEKYLDVVTKKINKKLIILHKESTFTPLEEKAAPKIYKNNNDKTLSDIISVYSEKQKKILVKSKIANNKQVSVSGCPRADYAFKLRKIKPKNDVIIFYLIEQKRSKNLTSHKTSVNWNELNKKTLEYLANFLKKNPDIKLILKGKTGVHKKKDNYLFKNLSNCKFIEGGTGEKLLEDAKVVIAFNSTIIFETIASNRKLIIPNFNNENKTKKNYIYRVDDDNFYVNSEREFHKKIKYYLTNQYCNKNLSKSDKKILSYYIGNTDGKSGQKVNKLIKNLVK